MAQGVFVPMPGSAPAATGPNAVNPSAAASSVDPSASNPSAAPSAVTILNALNPSATPSTFAPQFSAPARTSILIGPVGPLYKIVPTPRRRRVARIRRQTQAADRQPRRLPFLARLHLPPNLRMIGGSSISWAASVAGAEIRPELSPQHHRDRQNPSTDLSVGGLGPPTASAASEDGVRVGKPRRSGQAPLRSAGGLGLRRCPRRASGWKLSEW